ncbi:MAG: hypothetical protein K9N23_20420 [Akkermansiaceae bacterium]|nr:hypothetical protein [Akkermansiaceae bacterium]MCF7734060.1 hypothetical protein [Akkermansiaceae bacterium]
MLDRSDDLIAAALRPIPFTDASRDAVAKCLLESVPDAHPDAVASLARWQRVDDGQARFPWRKWLAAILLALSAWVLAVTAQEARRIRAIWPQGLFEPPSNLNEVLTRGMSPQQRFLLLGDASRDSEAERMRSLWDSAPDKAAYFAAFASAYQREHGTYPPDDLKVARRLDPDNAWFTYHAAGELAGRAVKKNARSSRARRAGEPMTWNIVNAGMLEQAIALLREGNGQLQYINRNKEFIALQVPLLPDSDLFDRFASAYHLAGYYGGLLTLRKLSDGIAAAAWRSGEAGDADSLRELAGQAEVFLNTVAEVRDPTLVEGLLAKVLIATVSEAMHAAAEKLGLRKEAARFGAIHEKVTRFRERFKQRQETAADQDLVMRSSFLGTSMVSSARRLVTVPPPISDADLRPGRMVERMFAARVYSLMAWIVSGIFLLGAAVFRLVQPRWRLRLAVRMNTLLLPVDWLWMMGAGVLLPFGLLTAVVLWTPLGGRAWGTFTGGGWLPLGTVFLTMTLLLLVVPGLLAAWRIGLRAKALGPGGSGIRLGWLVVVCALAAIPSVGLVAPPTANLGWNLLAKGMLLAPLLLFITAAIVRAPFGKPFHRLFRLAVVSALIPCVACGMVLLLASAPIYQHAQSEYQSRDQTVNLGPTGISHDEAVLARILLAEIRETLLEDK